MRMAVHTRTSLDFGLLYSIFYSRAVRRTFPAKSHQPWEHAKLMRGILEAASLTLTDPVTKRRDGLLGRLFQDISSWSWFDQQPLRLESWTGEAHFYAPAFSYVLRTKKGWEKDTVLEVDAVSSTRKEAAPLKPITWRILWPDQINDAQWQNPCSRELCFINVLTKWAVLVTKVS